MIATTQEHLPIKDIKNNIVLLKDGGAAVVLETSAVNFDLLSEIEQLAIIDAFAALLNSLSFPIQIVIRSKRLDISSYLDTLKKVQEQQPNPLLVTLIKNYRNFVETIIRENEVLDKQFYVIIPIAGIEVGFMGNSDADLQKTATLLMPRRDNVVRQLNRIGLRATQLTNEALIKLYYDIYNGNASEKLSDKAKTAPNSVEPNNVVQAAVETNNTVKENQPQTTSSQTIPVAQMPSQQTQTPPQSTPVANAIPIQQVNRSAPFVVEELND